MHSHLFLESGCLTMEAIEAYHQNRLTAESKDMVLNHLQQCELCRNAVEGLIAVPDFPAHKTRILYMKEKLHHVMLKTEASHWYRNRTIGFIAMAASLLLLVGLFSLYTFILKKESGLVAEEQKMHEPLMDSVLRSPQEPVSETEQVNAMTRGKGKTSSDLQRKQEMTEESETGRPETKDALLTGGIPDADERVGIQPLAKESTLPPLITDTLKQRSVIKTESPVEAMAFQEESKNAAIRGIDEVRYQQGVPAVAVPEKEAPIIPDIQPRFHNEHYENFQMYLSRHIRYPDSAVIARLQGKVLIGCDITKEGNVQNARVLESAHPLLDREALRVINTSPAWTPAMLNHQPVQTFITVPVVFKLDSTLLEKK